MAKRKYTLRKGKAMPYESGSLMHEVEKFGRPSKKKK
jgi:hypothetical protein